MKRRSSLIAALLVCCFISQGRADNPPPNAPASEYLFYRWKGGFSIPNWIEVRIQSDGQSTISYGPQGEKPVSRTLSLTPAEMQALKIRIRAAGEPNLLDHAPPNGDLGTTAIRLTRDGKVAQWTFAHHAPLEPTTQFLQSMFNQAVILHALEARDDASPALGALSASSASPKALRPAALEAPLRALVHRASGMSKLEAALDALSHLASPNELMGIFATELESAKPERKIELLYALSFGGPKISRHHRLALIPLLSLELQPVYKEIPDLPSHPKQVYERVISFLGDQRSADAVDILILIARTHAQATEKNQGVRASTRVALAKIGYSAIAPLMLMLEDKSLAVRIVAADTLSMMVEISPHGRSPDERKPAISNLKQLLPNIERQARTETDPNARYSFEQIVRLIRAEP
jgi:hypothetical protein